MDRDFADDELTRFAAGGPPPLPGGGGVLERDGVRLWFGDYGEGPAVVLLHGGMGNAGNFGHQVPPLIAAGYRVIAMDSRGQGRSSWDGRPFSYEQYGEDVAALLDHIGVERAVIVGWSDGACTGLALARAHKARVSGVFFFACNVDASGTWPFEMTDVIGNCLARHQKDYAVLSPTPDGFDAMGQALQVMQSSQPNYSAADLASIDVPVCVAQASGDEFIRPEHARYIAETIPGARLVALDGVSHFAPVQRPALFNGAVLDFLASLPEWG
ncbi:alpha/beta hydrolase [Devosia sp. XJ19-1]|uniref:Alpha/beta hydrolase n=1 Tax=Devosia ureilytica TaxID=2952754 RepID=A0A9Q4AQB9_9HYPH|nr:alpha/beta hydrolase [Devosia ureilytica]MCP8884168.1 alpha/beta hydrolase [Devosia ureilytica]MCP8887776.1 alpha/beta hydrolase [Devosia ureilytica]